MSTFSLIKIVLLGDARVGKTTLRKVYLGESFRNKYLATIGADFSLKSTEIEDKKIDVQIWDIAGQMAYSRVMPKYYMGAIGAIIMYSRTDYVSVRAMIGWIEMYLNHNGYADKCNPILIIGNKSDLVDDPCFISDEDHKSIVKDIQKLYPRNIVEGMMTSGLSGENVEIAFDSFFRKCHDWILDINKFHSDFDKNYRGNFPYAAIFALNDYCGPLYLTSVPEMMDIDLESILSSMRTLFASQDLSTLEKLGPIRGKLSWEKPYCIFYYEVFYLPNADAKDGKEIFVIGLGIKPTLLEFPIDILLGIEMLTHIIKKEFINFRYNNNILFTTQKHDQGVKYLDLSQIKNGLDRYRLNSHKHIKSIFESYDNPM